MFLQGEEERHDGDGDENRASSEITVFDRLRADVLFEGDRQCVVDFVVHKCGGEDELVPCGHEAEERGDGDGWACERQDDGHEDFCTRGAVNNGGFFELFGYGVEIAFKIPDAEWEGRNAVDEDEAEDVIGETEFAENDVEGDHHDDAREHLCDEESLESHLASDEVESCETVGGCAGEEYADDRRNEGNDDGIGELVEEEIVAILVLVENDVFEVVECELNL